MPWPCTTTRRTTPCAPPLVEAQFHQRDDIFALAVLKRAYDRALDALGSVSNRLGVLIAVRAAIEAVLIDKIHEFGR